MGAPRLFFILMEKCQRDLSEAISEGEGFERWEVIEQTARALAEVHRKKKVHADVRAANIFISKEGKYKLGDFGEMIDVDKPPARRAAVAYPDASAQTDM